MLYLKETPTGIDIPIQRLQQKLYDHLRKAWKLEEDEFQAFGRVYRNQTDKGYIPEAYIGNGEYHKTFIDDRLPVTMFFMASDSSSAQSGNLVSTVSVIFCVNLARLKPAILHRADEEVHFDVFGYCQKQRYTPESMDTGTDRVFKEFSGLKPKFHDMHPFHCFRLNLKISYSQC